MKKIFYVACFLLCSCKSITYQDVNPIIKPNNNLLPAIDILVDINNLEATYSSGSFSSIANNFGTAYMNNHAFGGWAQIANTQGQHYKDARVNDAINIFNKEVLENISNPYGVKKGYISLRLGYRGSEQSYVYPLVSIVSLFTINFMGFPYNKLKETLEVEVQIMNNKKEIIKRYVENVSNSNLMAMWRGYDGWPTLRRKVAADNIKQALEIIRKKT